MRYYAISAALHALCFILVLMGTAGSGKGKYKDGTNKGGEGSKYDGTIIPGKVIPKERVEVAIIETPVTNGKGKKPPSHKKNKKIKQCGKRWYGGIGIASGRVTGYEEVLEVFPGYPADNAGIKSGDIILDVSGGSILGSPGTSFTMSLSHEGISRIITLIRERICY